MPGVLAGKTALVTGASRNLGRGIAEKLAASGALVAINYASNDAAARQTLAAIETHGGTGFLLRQKLGTAESAQLLAAALTAELARRTGEPGLDVLVNNVGGGDYSDIHTTTPEAFEATVSNNIRAPFYVTQALLPVLRTGGRVINLSSAASRLALPEVIVYSMCKAAVDMFTRVMAKELGPRRITVNAVLPGFNETESNAREANDPGLRQQIEALTALGRFGQPADIAAVVHAIASPEMGWVTGQIIEASGGFRL
jgi:NAD(P)-dependent dehydrogenase (short-subunit alcohol dehydrogenase family)